MFWLLVENRRPVLEQLELSVNSGVCVVEVVVRASSEGIMSTLDDPFHKTGFNVSHA